MNSSELEGRSILVTRPGRRGKWFANELGKRGAEVFWQAALTTEPLEEALDVYRDVLPRHDLLIVSSPRILQFTGVDTARLYPGRVAVVGSATAQAWRRIGVEVLAEAATLRGLISLLATMDELKSAEVLWPHGSLAQDDVVNPLKSKVAQFHRIEVYRTIDRYQQRELNLELCAPGTIVTFASPSAVHAFRESLRRQDALDRRSRWTAVAIGPTTARALEAEAWKDLRIAATPDLEGQVRAIAALG